MKQNCLFVGGRLDGKWRVVETRQPIQNMYPDEGYKYILEKYYPETFRIGNDDFAIIFRHESFRTIQEMFFRILRYYKPEGNDLLEDQDKYLTQIKPINSREYE